MGGRLKMREPIRLKGNKPKFWRKSLRHSPVCGDDPATLLDAFSRHDMAAVLGWFHRDGVFDAME